MLVADVSEKVNLILREEQSSGYRVNRCITPSLIIETPLFIKEFKVLLVCFSTPEIEVCNLEIGPEMAQVVVGFLNSDEVSVACSSGMWRKWGVVRGCHPLSGSVAMKPNELSFAMCSGCSLANS